MVKFNKLAVSAAVIVMAASAFCGCGKKAQETTAAETAAETETAAEASESEAEAASGDEEAAELYNQMADDAEKIAALDPKMPENVGTVELGEYKGLIVEGPVAKEITDDEVRIYMMDNVIPYCAKEVTDDTVQIGDIVNINYCGTRDGVAFDGGTAEGYDLVIGSGTFIPGFEDGLIGVHSHESVDLNLTFPEDYGNEELAGAEVVFAVDVNKITRPITYDEFDDAAAQDLSHDPEMTAEAYIAKLKKSLQDNEDNSARSDLYLNAIDQVVAASNVVPSEDAINWQQDIYIQNYNQTVNYQYGMDLASMLYMYGSTYDEFRANLRDAATDAAARVLIEYAILDAEGLGYTEAARDAYFTSYGYEQEIIDQMITPAEQEIAVVGDMACKVIIDNAAEVKYVEAEEAEKTE